MGYWHFAFLGQESIWAAEASECAGDQDAFWEYHSFLFTDPGRQNPNAFSKENLKRIAADLGLDSEAFDQCLDSGKYTQFIQQQTTTARQMGVSSTPTFVINGQPLIGAQPFEEFKRVIESSLKDAQ